VLEFDGLPAGLNGWRWIVRHQESSVRCFAAKKQEFIMYLHELPRPLDQDTLISSELFKKMVRPPHLLIYLARSRELYMSDSPIVTYSVQ
jgi:hypothetical protein